MTAAVCIDDNYGMLFCGRRQSRDREMIGDLKKKVMDEGKRLWIHSFSRKLFAEDEYVSIDDDFLNKASEGEVCFVENQSLKVHENKIEELIVYRWNRKYPSDFWMDINLSDWTLVETIEFEGYSHEKITREIYKK